MSIFLCMFEIILLCLFNLMSSFFFLKKRSFCIFLLEVAKANREKVTVRICTLCFDFYCPMMKMLNFSHYRSKQECGFWSIQSNQDNLAMLLEVFPLYFR